MPCLDSNHQRELSRRHYLNNPETYNPSRLKANNAGREAREIVLLASYERWVSPAEIMEICVMQQKGLNLSENHKAFVVDRCIRNLPGAMIGGVFMGVSPFDIKPTYGPRPTSSAGDVWARQEFLKALPKARKSECGVELLILKLTLQRKMSYGY